MGNIGSTTDAVLGAHQERSKQLLNLLQRHISVLEKLEIKPELDDIRPQVQTVTSQHFKILVTGEFNRGKSTVINALLGEEVLPAYPVETTAIINEIKWGDTKRALLYRGEKEHPVPFQDLEKHVVVKKGQNNPYDKVQIFWPLALCGNGVEIIDSPGLNVCSQERMDQTYKYLPTVDAIIFVADALTAGSGSEVRTIEKLKDMGHTSILFVCNKIDLINPKHQQIVKDQFIENFAPHTKPGEQYIFFLNAMGALQGRVDKDERAVRASGILHFEAVLKDFLVNERGRIKLLHPAQAIRSSVQRVLASFVDRKIALQKTHEALQRDRAQAEKRLVTIELSRQTIIANFESFRHKMEKFVQHAAVDFYNSQIGNVMNWASAYEIQEPLKIGEIITNNQEAKKRVINEVQEALSDQMNSAFKVWEEQTLHPLINKEIENYSTQLTQRVRKFAEDFEQVRSEALQGTTATSSTSSERVEALLRQIQIQTSDYSNNSLTIDKEFGFGKMMKLLLPHGGIFGALTILLGWHPFVFIPAVAVAAIINMIFHKDGVNEKIREEVGKSYKQQLSRSARELGSQVAEATDQQFEEFQHKLDHALENEIKNFDQILQNAIKAVKQGNVDQELQKLEYCRDELNAINGSIEGMMGQLVLIHTLVA